ncbi:MAG: AMP-binding protein [Mycobacteriaceae bacterium]|nr:AMP-binding protein [Mycobacteriaceae bacterium]
MNARSLPAALRTWARLEPNDVVYTYIDYEQDWNGVPHSLTWSQMYRRALNVAQELSRCASPGDRALILAPQGLEYIAAFLGALQAGVIAAPLSVPQGGATDERVDSVLQDASPAAVFTTSAVVDDVARRVKAHSGGPAPAIIEIDSLNLDAPNRPGSADDNHPGPAYLQYTSGSTRTPAGVEMSHENLRINFRQMMAGYFAQTDGIHPHDMTAVTWLPFYHDLGLYLGICAPILGGFPAVITSPLSFLQRPARWMHMMASHSQVFSAGPNFAFELAAKKVTDDDMAGFDLGNVNTIVSGSERVQPATLQRFADRFARCNLQERALRPAYGLAEATLYVANSRSDQPPETVHFDSAELTAGHGKRCATGSGTPLVSYLLPQSPILRIVDPDTCAESPEGTVGEIWVHGDNVSSGYWGKPAETERTFGAKIVRPSEGTPEGHWLRTGDSAFSADGKFFIIGRLKDLLIMYGRNHSPDDLEATIQEITRGRCVAIAVPGERSTEKLVAIIELKNGNAGQDAASWADRLGAIKREVTSALSSSHGLSVADLVLVPPGSIPITTSGKVRRSACVEQYRQDQFARLDA